ncbi:MAG: hypothetical protein ACMUIM_03875 [bacterium]
MKRSKHSWREEIRIIELIEQSVFLVRSTFSAYGWIYYLSTIPFIITLMHFWSIMSSKLIMPYEISRFALLLNVLFWIIVTGQAIYCRALMSTLMDEKPGFSLSDLSNTALNGIFVQPLAIILQIISFILVFPLGYAIIFSQYLFIVSSDPGISILKTIKTAYRFATQETIYQHLVLFFLISLFLIIFSNTTLTIFLLPQMLKKFFNLETVFTQSAFSVLNTTFIMIARCISYLIFDPICKGFFVKLYFHVKSRSSGEDIMAECRRLSQKRGLKKGFIGMLLIIGLICACPSHGLARESHKKISDMGKADNGIEKSQVEKLDRAIIEVSKDDLYRWRYRNKKAMKPKKENGFILQMIEDLFRTLGNWLKPVVKFMDKTINRIIKALRKWFSMDDWFRKEPTEPFWSDIWPQLLTIVTVLIFLMGVIYLFWQHHKDKVTIIRSKKRKIPDLTEEEVDATELEEEEWLKLGKELRAKGELTLALRSVFLAILSFFHRKNCLSFERYKTNYNYLSEVRENSRNNMEMIDQFRLCIDIFERSWYGKYPVDMEILERFQTHQKAIMEKFQF